MRVRCKVIGQTKIFWPSENLLLRLDQFLHWLLALPSLSFTSYCWFHACAWEGKRQKEMDKKGEIDGGREGGERERERDRETERETERDRERQRETERDRQRQRERERERERQRERQRQRETERDRERERERDVCHCYRAEEEFAQWSATSKSPTRERLRGSQHSTVPWSGKKRSHGMTGTAFKQGETTSGSRTPSPWCPRPPGAPWHVAS